MSRPTDRISLIVEVEIVVGNKIRSNQRPDNQVSPFANLAEGDLILIESVQYLNNVCLKINAKLGGLNHQLHSESLGWLKNTMLVGMDVTHPTAVGCVKGTPSIAAVVASCDSDFMHYPASLRLQKHRKEVRNVCP